ncbi:hypothetical protein BP6252_03322 [Coleophoma cylindrospora]|uniref:Uncharacterized protein n=1 Tax=Coleophoma cylindrospora TaxID=1849047 RepID=A0A3D8S7N5_9HELO|nr:hypothetical protein BP6252_03322 [Coleophoma cylindrospora]
MRATTRLGAVVLLSSLSLVSFFILLLPNTVSTRLQKIALGTNKLDGYVPGIWKWASGDVSSDAEGGRRLVVFGDAWVDDKIDAAEQARGLVWTEVLCEEIDCTSHLNLAVSQPIEAYPSAPPTGALASNNIYLSALNSSMARTSSYLPSAEELLPDLESQITKYLTFPKSKAQETIFLISFGLWDIYHYSGFEYSEGQKLIEETIYEIFRQVDRLYLVYRENVISELPTSNGTEPAPFRIIVPKLFDSTLLPGWSSQRPTPMVPSSVSEQQKMAVWFTTRWNDMLENRMGAWIQNDTLPLPVAMIEKDEISDAKEPKTREEAESGNAESTMPDVKSLTVRKDAFYYDIDKYVTDVIIEHQLEIKGLSDASGLGKGESPFETVKLPCVISAEEKHRQGDTEVNGLLFCEQPEEYLFWDDFRLGPIANEHIGSEVAKMVQDGKSMRKIWSDGKGHS